VIIVENCMRLLGERQHQLGRPLTKAERLGVVFDASRQVRSATAFGEAIIIIVYLPILALTGVAGKMFRPMALTVILALAAAFVLSLTFVPAMVAILMTGRVRERENVLVRVARAAYDPLLRGALRWRAVVVPAAVVVFAASLLLLRQPDENHPDRLGRDFIPKLDEWDVLVIAMRPPSAGLTESIRIQKSIERALLTIPEVQFVASKIGTGDAASDPIPMSDADTFIVLKARNDWPDPKKPKAEVVKAIEGTLDEVPGSTYEYLQPIEDRFNELIAGVRTDVAVEVVGEDFAQTLPAAEAVFKLVRDLGGKDVQEPKGLDALPALRIDVDRAACARYGLSVADMQDVVQTAVAGREAGVVLEGDQRVKLVVRLPESMRQDLHALAELPVPLPKAEADAAGAGGGASPRAGYVPLSAVAHIAVTTGPREIAHTNGRRNVVVTFNVRGRDVGSFVAEARREVERTVAPTLPAGNLIEWGGQFRTMEDTWRRLGVIVPLGFFFILVLLYSTFGSLRDALVVFSGVPLALVGGIVALWLRRHEMNLSISAGVGFIALSGVAVLNGLVMVSFINQLRAEGLPLDEAVRRGSLTRLRPVLMTALVASLGFVPMALARGSGAEVQKPLATVVIGGIVSSTLLTLLVLPALYRLLHRGSGPVAESAPTPREAVGVPTPSGAAHA
jgi:cobalt-zinc-cadmium resistance protein CzcA